VIESFTSRAFAGSIGPGAFACSYALVVFAIGGKTYAVKFKGNQTTCAETNTDGMYTGAVGNCGGTAFTISGNMITLNGSAVTPDPLGTCTTAGDWTITNNGQTVNAGNSITILFALVHDGSFGNAYPNSGPGQGGIALDHAATFCNPGSSFVAPRTCTNTM
jgi:hypothetical protein